MDSLYIGDIPLENSDEVRLYFDDDGFPVICKNIASLNDDDNLITYKLLNNVQNNKFIYESIATQKKFIKSNFFYSINVSHNWYDRPDCFNILFFTFCVALGSIFLINIFTSIFRKGGLLSGLL